MTNTHRPQVDAQSGRRRVPPLFALLVTLASCGSEAGRTPVTGPAPDPQRQSCSIPRSSIFTAAPAKDWIPALSDPAFVGPDDPALEVLKDSDRVVGLEIAGRAYAVPVNILWWHEIVNLDEAGALLAITHCPLTGSSLVFDREPLGGVEFGVSGLLYLNNLIMYDRSTGESLWPQMLRGARCGVKSGTSLRSVAAIEIRWDRWRALHPDTRVVSPNTGFQRSYDLYPYGDYDRPTNEATLFPRRVLDTRRPPKERVLGVPYRDETLALPFGVLAAGPPLAAIHPSVASPELVVLWDAAGEAAMAYDTRLDDGRRLALTVAGGRIVDDETGSVWRVDGRAVSGPLSGTRLTPVAQAHVAFWFAWIDFHPDTRLVEAP